MEAATTPHPSPETLGAYGLGQLDAGAAAAVERHISACDDCRKTLSAVSADTFLGRLRDARPSAGSSTMGISQVELTRSFAGPPAAETIPPGLADHPDYEIKRELGRGGMGVVYLAHNALMGRDEVLKVMGRQLVERPEVLERFLREIRAVAKLRHANIVAAYSTLRMGENLVFAMEYVPGLDLARMVKAKGPLPIANACKYIHQAALGLQHAHERGLVHRDIKPANLMLSHEGGKATVKILDFGLAKAAREERVDGALTSQGQALGTPDFIAPEQILDAPSADVRADIYSLGGTLYYLLTGGPPFRATSLYDMYQAHISRTADPINVVRPEVPAELAALVAKMMAKEPERRFQTPAEVAQALAPFFKKAEPGKENRAEVSRISEVGLTTTVAESPAIPIARPPAREFARTVVESPPLATPLPSAVDLDAFADSVEALPADVVLRRSPPRRTSWLWPTVAAGGLGAAIIVFLLLQLVVKTPEGTIVIEGLPTDAVVTVDGQEGKVWWKDGGAQVEVRAVVGQHKLEVTRAGITTYGEIVEFRKTGDEKVTIRLDPPKSSTASAAIKTENPLASTPSLSVPTEKSELAKLQGSWEWVSENNGEARPYITTYYGDHWYNVRGTELTQVGQLRVDPSPTPRQIDGTVTFWPGPNNLGSGLWIYEWRGNEILIKRGKIPGPRPTDFSPGDAVNSNLVRMRKLDGLPDVDPNLTPAQRAELTKLQGRWQYLERNGVAIPEESRTLTFIGDQYFNVTGDAKLEYAGKFTVDPTQTPRQADITRTFGKSADRSSWIYEFRDDELWVKLSSGDQPRPTDFTPGDGTPGIILFRLRRIGEPLSAATPDPIRQGSTWKGLIHRTDANDWEVVRAVKLTIDKRDGTAIEGTYANLHNDSSFQWKGTVHDDVFHIEMTEPTGGWVVENVRQATFDGTIHADRIDLRGTSELKDGTRQTQEGYLLAPTHGGDLYVDTSLPGAPVPESLPVEGDAFAVGSAWMGLTRWPNRLDEPQDRPQIFTITERDGDSFKGIWKGAYHLAPEPPISGVIQGTVKQDVFSASVVLDNRPDVGIPIEGKIHGDRIDLNIHSDYGEGLMVLIRSQTPPPAVAEGSAPGAATAATDPTPIPTPTELATKAVTPAVKKAVAKAPRKVRKPSAFELRYLGVWKHIPFRQPVHWIDLKPNGAILSGNGQPIGTWGVDGNGTLVLRWPNAQAPGGAWLDSLVITPDGQQYHGKNQKGAPIHGARN